MTLHIGILQTDFVLPQFREVHGDYPEMFRALLAEQSAALQFTHYDVQVEVPAELECDAYIITGSKHSVYDDLPWIAQLAEFVGSALAEHKKVVGVCFGHQLIAHFFGGEVAAAEQGWAVGVHHSNVVGEPHWMAAPVPRLALLSSHKDQVVQLPPQARVYLSSEFCPIAGFTMGEHALTVQGHPEFSKEYAAELMDMRREMLGDAVYQQGQASLTDITHEQDMARWMLNFMRGG